MSPAASLAAAAAGRPPSREFGHVLAGVVPDGPAARLAGMLDPAFLAEAGWDPAARVLSLPAGHSLLGRAVCRAGGCTATVRAGLGGVCHRCFTRLTGLGLTSPRQSPLSTTIRSSSKEAARARRVPPAPSTSDDPSKTSWSLPPT